MPSRNYHSFSTSVRRRATPHGVDSMFAWTIFIFLLIGFTLFCWMGSFYIFGHPEKAPNYHLLKRLHKLEELQRFQITAAPRGEFLKPEQLLERFGSLTPIDTKRLNEVLFRNFLRNYHQTRELVPYATGTYKVLAVIPLTKNNLFYPGVVALLQSLEQPEIFLEQVFTSKPQNLEALQSSLIPGHEIKLEKPWDLSAIIFIEHLHDGQIKFTTMPLLYGTYGSKQGKATFSLEPPDDLNIEAGLPILTSKEIEAAHQYAIPCHKKTNLLKSEKTTLKNEGLMETNTQLARIITEEPSPTPINSAPVVKASSKTSSPITNVPQPTNVARAIPVNAPAVLPAIAVSTPAPPSEKPVATPIPFSIPATKTASAIIATATPLPTPASTPPPLAFSPAAATAAPTLSPEQTNLPSTSATTVTNTSSNMWPVYEPGKMPRGRLIDPTEFPALAEQGVAGERLYLQGDFSVTASGEHRAVLRYQSAAMDLPIGRTGKIRVIVAYADGTIPPAEGTSIAQDRQHPLMVTDIKKEKDGTIDLYAREITK